MTTIKEVSIQLGAVAQKNGAEIVQANHCCWCLFPFYAGNPRSDTAPLPMHPRCESEMLWLRGIIPSLTDRIASVKDDKTPTIQGV